MIFFRICIFFYIFIHAYFLYPRLVYAKDYITLKSHAFHITKKQLGSALLDLSEQVNINIVFSSSLVKGKIVNPIRGDYTIAQTLKILLHESGLQASISEDSSRYASLINEI